MTAYYNEIDPYAAQWLRNLISKNLIAPGDVDERSIVDVHPEDLKGYAQCHFFAGIGGWSLAARIAGWPDDRPLWTGSCPCQPFSAAGKGEGKADERHLWPTFFGLIRSRRPSVVMGEQVAAAVGKDWLDGVHSDLESVGYASGAAVVPACAVDAPHRRDRLWFVAHADASERRTVDSMRGRMAGQHAVPQGKEAAGRSIADGEGFHQQGPLAYTEQPDQRRHAGDPRGASSTCGSEARAPDGDAAGCPRHARRGSDHDTSAVADAQRAGLHASPLAGIHREAQGERAWDVELVGHRTPGHGRNSTAWSGAEWITGADGKARRFEPGIRLLAHGVPARVGKLRAYGNAIVPQVAAEIIGAYIDAHGLPERIAA